MAMVADSVRPGWGVLLGWLSLALIGVGTGLHALRRRALAASGALGASMLALLCTASPARAAEQQPGAAPAVSARPGEAPVKNAEELSKQMRGVAGSLSKYSINHDDPSSSVPTPEQRDKDPLEYGYFLMDLGDQAEWAIKRGDHLAAAKYFRAYAKAVPDVPVAFVRACNEYEAAGDLESAANFCAAALTLPGVKGEDFAHYARIAMARPNLTDADIANLDLVVMHLKDDGKTRSMALDIQCTLGARLADRGRLEQCVPQFSALAPDSPKTMLFQWALALKKGDFAGAEKALSRMKVTAKELNASDKSFSAGELKHMEKVTYDAMPLWRKAVHDWRIFVPMLTVVIGGVGIATLGKRRRAIAGA
jgi:tetratricopeptide (TPR) repeat protein